MKEGSAIVKLRVRETTRELWSEQGRSTLAIEGEELAAASSEKRSHIYSLVERQSTVMRLDNTGNPSIARRTTSSMMVLISTMQNFVE